LRAGDSARSGELFGGFARTADDDRELGCGWAAAAGFVNGRPPCCSGLGFRNRSGPSRPGFRHRICDDWPSPLRTNGACRRRSRKKSIGQAGTGEGPVRATRWRLHCESRGRGSAWRACALMLREAAKLRPSASTAPARADYHLCGDIPGVIWAGETTRIIGGGGRRGGRVVRLGGDRRGDPSGAGQGQGDFRQRDTWFCLLRLAGSSSSAWRRARHLPSSVALSKGRRLTGPFPAFCHRRFLGLPVFVPVCDRLQPFGVLAGREEVRAGAPTGFAGEKPAGPSFENEGRRGKIFHGRGHREDGIGQNAKYQPKPRPDRHPIFP